MTSLCIVPCRMLNNIQTIGILADAIVQLEEEPFTPKLVRIPELLARAPLILSSL